ncbi:uncharacterized protein LY89DRAFT_87938 [Mollisia scopiformis]|uniref:Uncharacterized protein n=1 Tax=Mollisia scopiformis TaxID=149040 RepID=A0A194X8V0_MOLSC|nr:uncharacterized protein LY89DRAFT_87938 [Mollisia scopiformis]KUJ16598.1 hypothetical protein LY89DRAFT_87938 [Mollisia scopiformis]
MAPEASTQYPLYNTTFSLNRVSPLYTSTTLPLNNTTLRDHARQFRDILAGEVLRGVRVGLVLEDDILARVGALQTVTWQLLPEEEAWSMEELDLDDEDTTTVLTSSRGMIVTVTYEKMAYKAILLKDDRTSDGETTIGSIREGTEEFQHFSLLLSKMPGPLREAFTDYLTSTFDTRVSNLHLSTSYLNEAFEHYISDLSHDEEGEIMDIIERSKTLRSVVKETVFIIGFDLSSASLKTIDISIAREDLPRMIARGKKLRGDSEGDSPFFDALAAYIKGHMALDMRHEGVKVMRIACGPFVLGSEGKIKLTQPVSNEDGSSPQSRATRRLINGLVDLAAGSGLKGAT